MWFSASHLSESFTSEQVFAYSVCKQTVAKQHPLNLVQSIADLQKLLGTVTPIWSSIWQGKKNAVNCSAINTSVWRKLWCAGSVLYLNELPTEKERYKQPVWNAHLHKPAIIIDSKRLREAVSFDNISQKDIKMIKWLSQSIWGLANSSLI